MEGWRAPQWRAYLGWLAIYLVISACVAFVVYSWLTVETGRPANLETTILMSKAVSLGALIIIGGAEIAHSKDCPALLRYANIAVMAYTGVVAILIIVKIVIAQSPPHSPGEHFAFGPTYEFMQRQGDFLSVTPLLICALINFVTILYYEFIGSNPQLKKAALSFFTVADLPCIMPILGVFLLVTKIDVGIGADQHARTIFISGAMAMFILISNNLTIVVRYIVLPAMGLAEHEAAAQAATSSSVRTEEPPMPNATF